MRERERKIIKKKLGKRRTESIKRKLKGKGERECKRKTIY